MCQSSQFVCEMLFGAAWKRFFLPLMVTDYNKGLERSRSSFENILCKSHAWQDSCEEMINFLQRGEVYSTEGSCLVGSCLTPRFKRANFNLQEKNFNESDEKRTAKTFANTSVGWSLFTLGEDLVLRALVLYTTSRELTLTSKQKTSLKVTQNERQRCSPKQGFSGHFNFFTVAC